MKGFDPRTSFGEDVAARYDAEDLRGDEDATVGCLERLAGGGPVLELAIGTGRIALPLAARGAQVHGIEQSAAMIGVLRAKPGGAELAVTQGDMAEVRLDERYSLVYLVFNTLHNLLTQDEQVRCVENAARHLTDDGVFLVEAGLPGPMYGLRGHQYVDAEVVEGGRVTLDVGRYDPVTQVLEENHVTLTAEGVRLGPIASRYVWPAELDLMARIAGLRLRHRWSGWDGEAFDAGSVRHVSVYGR